MTPETTEKIVVITEDSPKELVEEVKALEAEPKDARVNGKKISARNMARLEKRVNVLRRNKEIQPIIKQYVDELSPATKRELTLVERIAALQLQVNQNINVESSKATMARLIKRVINRG